MTNKVRHILFLVALFSIMGIGASSVYGQVGFHAEFEPYPFFVSPYEEISTDYSAAIYPNSYPLLSQEMRRAPKIESSSFDRESITFKTSYYQYGQDRQWLVPVSVDAPAYSKFRQEKKAREKSASLFSTSVRNPDKKKGRGGIGISVALPKRLDKIFGEGGAGLNVTGFRRITFSGRSQWTDVGNSDAFRQSKFPSLNMEQISKFQINGTIGTKISVKVSQDSQTDIPLSNRLEIRYKGDDDDILKSVEAGNTTLNIPNTQFVGYSQRIRGLFGLKAEAQVGALRITGIMSQEKGASENASFTSSTEQNADYIRDFNFVRNRIFDLFYEDEIGVTFDPANDSIKVVYVYEQVATNDNQSTDAIYNTRINTLPDNTSLYVDEFARLRMKQVKLSEYLVENDRITGRPRIIFNNSRSESKTLAFYVEIAVGGDPNNIRTFGDVSQTASSFDSLFLKALSWNSNSNSPDRKAWELMWRNVYQMPRGVEGKDLDMKIFKGLNGTESSPVSNNLDNQQEGSDDGPTYMEILGIDQYSGDTKTPDNRMDDHRTEIFRSEWSLLFFPERTPFSSDVTFSNLVPLKDAIPEIYNSLPANYSGTQASKYYISVTTRTRSAIIRLNRPNIIEGSERVVLNGTTLKRGTDYSIRYEFGQITLMNQQAQDPNAELTINYEYAPFISLAKKTLFGLRLQYDWSDDIKFGTTFLYKSDKAQDRKPRVGQETATMMVLDADASFRFKPQFVTDAIDALPLISTDVQSNFNLSTEVAQSRPNPNVDNVAYVDDFETAVDQLSLGRIRTRWHLASPPPEQTGLDTTIYKRGHLLWHRPNLSSEEVLTEDVYNRQTRQGESILNRLRIIYTPAHDIVTIGVDGQGNDIKDTTYYPSYAGITQSFSGVDKNRVSLFEFRARISAGSRGKLHFDFGKIDEDLHFHSDSSFNTLVNTIGGSFNEDGSIIGKGPNDILEDEEDVGLDGIANHFESGYDKDTLPDPAGDNWYFEGEGECPLPPDQCALLNSSDSPLWLIDTLRYKWLNGTEGNRRDGSFIGAWDKESLRDGFNQVNAYYTYEIDLANNPYRIDSSFKNDWYTYRIPILDESIKDSVMSGQIRPSWDAVTHVRVWFESDETMTEPDTLEIADWYFVQNNWNDTVQYTPLSSGSTKLVVASISTEDSTFTPPPGVEAYKDPTYNVEEPQRGLMLRFTDMQYQDTVMAIKELISVDQYSGYQKMKMYVNLKELNGGTDSVEFFLRLGQDNRNYYEHRQMIALGNSADGWDPINWVSIDFQELTGIKDKALQAGVAFADINIREGKYRVVGNPNLNQIRMFAVGVTNNNVDTSIVAPLDSINGIPDTLINKAGPIDGEVWVDELRVTDVRRDIGTAARVTVSGSMADLFSYNASFLTKDPYFRSISAATRGGGNNNLGSGQTETNVAYGITMHLEKFLPRSWGASIPISYNYRKNSRTPLLRNNTDIVLPEELREEEKSTTETSSLSVSNVSFKHKGRNPLFSLFLNRLTNTSFSYGLTKSRSVQTPYRFGENINFRSGIDFGWKSPPSVRLFFWTKSLPILKKTNGTKLYLYPTNFRITGTYTRSLTVTENNQDRLISTIKRDLNGSIDITQKIFDNLTASYKYSTVRDLADLTTVSWSLSDLRLGLETRYQQNFSSNYDPKLFTWITSALTFRSTYSETYDRSYKVYQSGMTQSYGVSGSFNHQTLLSGGSGGSERRFRGRSNVRGGGAKKKEEKSGTPFYLKPIILLKKATAWIRPFAYKYDVSYKNSTPGLTSRPGWKYQFAFTRDIGGIKPAVQNRRPSASESKAYSLSSGFTLFGGLQTDVSFRRSISRDLISVNGDLYENISTSWPDLGLKIKPFRSLPLIKGPVNKFIKIFSPRTGFSRQTRRKYNASKEFDADFSESINYSPLLAVNLKLIRALQITAVYSILKDKGIQYNTNTGEFTGETRSTKKTIAFTSKYSFSSPGGFKIPLLGRLKFRSTMSIELNVKTNRDIGEKWERRDNQWNQINNRSDFSVAPKISYQFSQQIRGGLSGRWQDSDNNGRKSHVREIQIWTEIQF